jgi:hypothetical protein
MRRNNQLHRSLSKRFLKPSLAAWLVAYASDAVTLLSFHFSPTNWLSGYFTDSINAAMWIVVACRLLGYGSFYFEVISMSKKMSTESTTAQSVQRKVPLFALGALVATPAVLAHLDQHDINAQPYLERHVSGDWGDVPPEDAQENQLSVEQGFRILSSYDIAGERVWVITEADRSSTTLLFPSEY